MLAHPPRRHKRGVSAPAPGGGRGSGTGRTDYGIAAVARTAELVGAMMRLGPSSLTRLAAEAGCTQANAFRILHTLRALGLVAQDGKRGPWQLGVGWLAVSRTAAQQGAVALAALPVLAAFAEQCGEATSLVVRDGEQCEVLAAHPANPVIRIFATQGERLPLHAGPGRMLLAYAPEPVLRGVLSSRLPRLGPATRMEASWIIGELPRIRARDWLITIDEVGDSVVTVSTPVRDRLGAVIGVLSIVSPAIRLRAPRPHTLLTPLAEAAKTLGEVIG